MNALSELTRSFLSFSWSMSLYGPVQAWRTAAAPLSPDEADRAESGYDSVAWVAGRELPGAWNEAFLAGDSLQRDLTDLGLAMLPRDLLDPGAWLDSGEAALTAFGEGLRFAVPDRRGRLAWREIGNKVEVFGLVKRVGEKIGVPGAGEPFDLPALVARSYELDSYEALWAVEGLGHAYADHLWPRGGPTPTGLLAREAADTVPATSLLMLHAGIGLAFAERRIVPLLPAVSPEEIATVVAEIVELCRANSLPGDVGAAWESMGLYTRSFHPQLLTAVDEAVRRVAPEVRGYYWHGAGRAFYFLPINFLPCGWTAWRPFEMAREQAPDEEARLGAWAGLAWAATLVNMRQPEVLAHLLVGPHGHELAANGGFANGVASSLVMRWDTTPGAELVERFLAYRPSGDPELARRWDELVRRPAETAVERWHPVLARAGQLGEVFRYQDLAALVARLS